MKFIKNGLLTILGSLSICGPAYADVQTDNQLLKNLVKKLYAEYAWELEDSSVYSKKVTFASENMNILSSYLSIDLAIAISNEKDKAAVTGEPPALDYLIIYDAQDPVFQEKYPLLTTVEHLNLKACFNVHTIKPHCITYIGKRQNGAVKIYDILGVDMRSLRVHLGLTK